MSPMPAGSPSLYFVEQRAIDIAKKATEEDRNENYKDAYNLYQNCLEYFMTAIRCTYAWFMV